MPNLYNRVNNSDNITTYFKHITKKNPLQGSYTEAIELLSEILTLHNCSLRDAERCYSTLSIVAASGGAPDRVYQIATAILVFLKIKNHVMFEGIKSHTVALTDVSKYLKIEKIKSIDHTLITRILVTDLGTEDQIDQFINANEKLVERYGTRIRALKEMLQYFDNLIV